MTTSTQTGFLVALICATWGANYALADVSGTLELCAGCHGENGISPEAPFPTIGGLYAEYLENALRAYRNDSRDCGDMPLMCKTADRLSDEEIEELAHHFADLEYQPLQQDFDAALAAKGAKIHGSGCVLCHGDAPDEATDGPILHGQRREYLSRALRAYAGDARDQPRGMARHIKTLAPEDLEALAHFYASFRP